MKRTAVPRELAQPARPGREPLRLSLTPQSAPNPPRRIRRPRVPRPRAGNPHRFPRPRETRRREGAGAFPSPMFPNSPARRRAPGPSSGGAWGAPAARRPAGSARDELSPAKTPWGERPASRLHLRRPPPWVRQRVRPQKAPPARRCCRFSPREQIRPHRRPQGHLDLCLSSRSVLISRRTRGWSSGPFFSLPPSSCLLSSFCRLRPRAPEQSLYPAAALLSIASDAVRRFQRLVAWRLSCRDSHLRKPCSSHGHLIQ